MNAGPDVERLIATWLSEEAPGRAPDRILGSAAGVIDHTKQRRFLAAWREPMTFTATRLAIATVIVVAAFAGGALFGRSTAGQAGAPAPTPVASPTASPATLETYRSARDAMCTVRMAALLPLLDTSDGMYDPALTTQERMTKITALDQIVAQGRGEVADLTAMHPPPDLVAEHAADVARHETAVGLIEEMSTLLKAGKLTEAQAIDASIVPISAEIQRFEAKYGLVACP